MAYPTPKGGFKSPDKDSTMGINQSMRVPPSRSSPDMWDLGTVILDEIYFTDE